MTPEPTPVGERESALDAFVDVAEWVALAERQMVSLTDLYERLRAEGRALDAMEVVSARGAVELLSALMVEVNGHRFDTQHLIDVNHTQFPRLADRMLYEKAGLPPLVYDGEAHLAWIEAVKACGRRDHKCELARCACSCHVYTREALADDIAAVLTVYDEHVAPENRGPWRDRLAEAVAALSGRPVERP